MKNFIFEFENYKDYLRAYIHRLPKKGYGFKSKMATFLECNTSYISQLLEGSAEMSLEQAENLNLLLKHSEAEGEFFIFLVCLARAGNERLRQRFRQQITQLRVRQSNLKERFQESSELNTADLTEFFSLWHRNALQIATTIHRLRTPEALRKALGLEEYLVREGLEFLLSKGLLTEKNGVFQPSHTRFFIGKDSPILKMHHANWRTRSIVALDEIKNDNLHYTTVVSLSTKDVQRLKERLIREIESLRQIVKDSKEEELHAFTMDFFRVDRD